MTDRATTEPGGSSVPCGATTTTATGLAALCTLPAGHAPAALHCDDDVLWQWWEPKTCLACGTTKVYEAYRAGHLDACQDANCVLRPDSTYPSYRDGWNDGYAAVNAICGLSGNYGALMEPLACAYPHGHDGPHAWASLPTFVDGHPSGGPQ